MIFTIGHSNHPIEAFIALLRRHGVTAIGDVRSHPYSRYVPQYSREPLKAALTQAGITYVFLGKELGARSENPTCYKQGKVQYDCLARQPQFAEGVRHIIEGMQRYCIALMCAEKDPLECHRTLLVARKLHEAGLEVTHIHADGSLEDHRTLESRLLGGVLPHFYGHLVKAHHEPGGVSWHRGEGFQQSTNMKPWRCSNPPV